MEEEEEKKRQHKKRKETPSPTEAMAEKRRRRTAREERNEKKKEREEEEDKNEKEKEKEKEKNDEEEPVRGPVLKDISTDTCTYYKNFTWKGNTYNVGDTILLSSSEEKDYVAVLEGIFEKHNNNNSNKKTVVDKYRRKKDEESEEEEEGLQIDVRWFFQNFDLRNGDIKPDRKKYIMMHENQVYWSFARDRNPYSVVLGHCQVHWAVGYTPPKAVEKGKYYCKHVFEAMDKPIRQIRETLAKAFTGDKRKQVIALLRRIYPNAKLPQPRELSESGGAFTQGEGASLGLSDSFAPEQEGDEDFDPDLDSQAPPPIKKKKKTSKEPKKKKKEKEGTKEKGKERQKESRTKGGETKMKQNKAETEQKAARIVVKTVESINKKPSNEAREKVARQQKKRKQSSDSKEQLGEEKEVKKRKIGSPTKSGDTAQVRPTTAESTTKPQKDTTRTVEEEDPLLQMMGGITAEDQEVAIAVLAEAGILNKKKSEKEEEQGMGGRRETNLEKEREKAVREKGAEKEGEGEKGKGTLEKVGNQVGTKGKIGEEQTWKDIEESIKKIKKEKATEEWEEEEEGDEEGEEDDEETDATWSQQNASFDLDGEFAFENDKSDEEGEAIREIKKDALPWPTPTKTLHSYLEYIILSDDPDDEFSSDESESQRARRFALIESEEEPGKKAMKDSSEEQIEDEEFVLGDIEPDKEDNIATPQTDARDSSQPKTSLPRTPLVKTTQQQPQHLEQPQNKPHQQTPSKGKTVSPVTPRKRQSRISAEQVADPEMTCVVCQRKGHTVDSCPLRREIPIPGDIIKVQIVRATIFGVKVKLEDFATCEGVIPKAQIPDSWLERYKNFEKGKTLWARVVGRKQDKEPKKIQLSLLDTDQNTGSLLRAGSNPRPPDFVMARKDSMEGSPKPVKERKRAETEKERKEEYRNGSDKEREKRGDRDQERQRNGISMNGGRPKERRMSDFVATRSRKPSNLWEKEKSQWMTPTPTTATTTQPPPTRPPRKEVYVARRMTFPPQGKNLKEMENPTIQEKEKNWQKKLGPKMPGPLDRRKQDPGRGEHKNKIKEGKDKEERKWKEKEEQEKRKKQKEQQLKRHVIPEGEVGLTAEERRLLEQAFHSLDQFNRLLVLKRQELQAMCPPGQPLPSVDGKLVRLVLDSKGREGTTYAVAKILSMRKEPPTNVIKLTVEIRLGEKIDCKLERISSGAVTYKEYARYLKDRLEELST